MYIDKDQKLHDEMLLKIKNIFNSHKHYKNDKLDTVKGLYHNYYLARLKYFNNFQDIVPGRLNKRL